MARARNIKPALFSNDDLAENDPLGRLLFIGLWTIADYKGELEWRPKRIKAQLLPYDNCDIKELAINLDKSGFIRFYSSQGNTYLKILNFEKHQNPHKNERDKGSIIPDYSHDLEETLESIGLEPESRKITINRDKDGSDPADSLIPYPDSLILIPDSVKPENGKKPSANKFAGVCDEIFNHWVLIMGKQKAKFTKDRKSKVLALLKEGYELEDFKKAIEGCAKSDHHMGNNPNGTVYDDLTLICRNGTYLEKFRDNIAKVTPQTNARSYQNEPETIDQFNASVSAQVERVFAPMKGFDA